MALWAQAQQLQGNALGQLHTIYGDCFPIEVRELLADWIEDKTWTAIDLDNPQHEVYAKNLVSSLIQELENKISIIANTNETFGIRLKLLEAHKMLKHAYTQDANSLFKIIQQCLKNEMHLLHQNDLLHRNDLVGSPNCGNPPMYNQNATDIMQDIEQLHRRIQASAENLRKLDCDQESFILSYEELSKRNKHLEFFNGAEQTPENIELKRQIESRRNMLDTVVRTKLEKIIACRHELTKSLKETCFLIDNTQSKILNEELLKWKREQQLQGNGAKYSCNLQMIQEFCESLAELIWTTRQQIKEAERLKMLILKYTEPQLLADVLPSLNAQITSCLSHLVTSTFIIEKQPPQVMKTNTRFSATVRLLTGSKLNVYMTPPQVKAQIISESQANALLKNEKIGKNDASGEILNNMGVMEYHAPSKVLSISLRNMQLKKIKRAEKRGTESVMDEKFSLYFSSQFSIGGGELVFQVWTLSLPVVVIVHGNQEPHAHATITWDNAFAEPGRSPFVVPDKRSWSMIADVLKMKFESATGRTLNNESLNFLAEKAFRAQYTDYSNMLLSWSQFCKEPLPDRNFTFWEWFYAVMKLTREHLKNVWTDGLVIGFVRKKQAEEMLAARPKGTFLLRFSDSELGGITIAWVRDNMEVYMLQPFTGKDFHIRSMVDRISDIPDLMYLYPDIPKDYAFSKYYVQDSPLVSNNGYVKPRLVTQIPGQVGGNQTPGYPMPTPPAMYAMHSPSEHSRDTPSVESNGHVTNSLMWENDFPDIPELNTIDEEDVKIDILHPYNAFKNSP